MEILFLKCIKGLKSIRRNIYHVKDLIRFFFFVLAMPTKFFQIRFLTKKNSEMLKLNTLIVFIYLDFTADNYKISVVVLPFR